MALAADRKLGPYEATRPASGALPSMNNVERVALAHLAMLFLVLLGCDSAEKGFERAAKSNTEQAYREFIDAHKAHPLASEARKRLESIAVESTRKVGTIEAYEDFIRRFPGGQHLEEMNTELSQLVARQSYRYVSPFKGDTGAHKITVRTTPNGLQINAGAVAFLARPGKEVEMSPRDAKFNFTVKEIEFDREAFGLASFVSVDLGKGVVLPARLVFQSGAQGLSAKSFKAVFPDAARSSDVAIVIDPAVGATHYAGLRFRSPVTVLVDEHGRVEADRDGVTATDSSGAVWMSRGLAVDGRPRFVFVKKP